MIFIMFNSWEEDRLYLERKFTDPEFYKNASGLPLAEIIEQLNFQAKRDHELPHAVSKAKGFEFLLENTQIAVSNNDYFPGLAFALQRPLVKSHCYDWEGNARARVLGDAGVEDFLSCYEVRLVHLRFDYEHSVPDWNAILTLGFSGLLERVIKYKNRHIENNMMTEKAADFFESVEMEYRAARHQVR